MEDSGYLGDQYSCGCRRRELPQKSPLVALLYLMVCCIAILTIILLVAFLYIFYIYLKRQDMEYMFPNTKPRLEDDNKKMLNFDGNERLCNKYRGYLPRPRSQQEEDLIVKEIKSRINPVCKFVFLGYVADGNVRYESLSGDVTWPSLKMTPDGHLPFDFKDCYELVFSENSISAVISVDDCGNKTGRSLLFITKLDYKLCFHHPFKCVEIYNSLPTDDVNTSFNRAMESNRNLLTLLPFDKEQPPETLKLQKTLVTSPVIVKAVKYKFRYKYGNEIQPYTSSRFTVIDPEYDCIAYDITRDRIVTRDCESNACAVCSDVRNQV